MLKIFRRGHKTLTSDLETWCVRWHQRYGIYSSQYKEVAQFFTNKEEAEEFAESLRRANKLLGHTCSTMRWVECKKEKSKGL
ncbi:hypothetical protein AB3N02_21775 [Priestia aryabhattai]|uniref:hypothetical protein n=1 Tax=Priestia aryabhattai TaxID=412384 RepID=UPI0039A3C973